ncbi:MAG: PIN domain-containing protein [Coriobacteriia bacterium]|nr:PIN domain-containing protein [Coriobacteriia bacterium]
MRKVVILDTNVLLADPNAVLSFPRAEVVIPETVLGELDKIKTARVDPDLRFRGREVTRLLFELGEDGSLIEGVSLPDGGTLRVAQLDTDRPLPEGLSTRQADDKILATAMQTCQTEGPECEVTLVTNDLNMLLKAQTLGMTVMRYGDGDEGGFARRYIIRPFQRYKVPLGILAIALGVFAAIIVIVWSTRPPSAGTASLPTEFEQLLSPSQQQALDALVTLENNPDDAEALLRMANFYFGLTEQARIQEDPASQIRWSQPGLRYYQRYLTLSADNLDARADLATLLFYAGQTDRAIQEIGKVLEAQPDHVNGNYNLGIVLLNGRNDLEGALTQFEKVVELTKADPDLHAIQKQAEALIAQIKASQDASAEQTQGATQ